MQTTAEKNAGISLILFIVLMVFTMVLHPAGGSFEQLLQRTTMVIITHSVAITSIPFAAVGFLGLTRRLGTTQFFSVTAFAFILLGLAAVLLAATANGLVLPLFIDRYKDASAEMIESIKPIMKYNGSVNHAFDYIYTGSFCIAILLWAVSILHTRRLPAWLGWAGAGIAATVLIALFAGLAVNSLHGLRISVSILAFWILLAGIVLARTK